MSIVLSAAELQALTGYKRPADQIKVLHKLGIMAWRGPGRPERVIVARSAYEAWKNPPPPPAPEPVWEPPKRVAWEKTPLGRRQALQRSFNEGRAEREAEQRRANAAYREATKPQREAAAKLHRAALVRYHASKRRVSKLQRTPPWADQGAIRAIYLEAQRLTRETRTPHHVDHIVPLQGRLVSGLHVENNLQILTGSENSRKRNLFPVEP